MAAATTIPAHVLYEGVVKEAMKAGDVASALKLAAGLGKEYLEAFKEAYAEEILCATPVKVGDIFMKELRFAKNAHRPPYDYHVMWFVVTRVTERYMYLRQLERTFCGQGGEEGAERWCYTKPVMHPVTTTRSKRFDKVSQRVTTYTQVRGMFKMEFVHTLTRMPPDALDVFHAVLVRYTVPRQPMGVAWESADGADADGADADATDEFW